MTVGVKPDLAGRFASEAEENRRAMSIINRWGDKVILPRIGPDQFWSEVRAHYAGAEPQKWKTLAMLALRVNAGWSLDMIGNAFGHERGHVSRSLTTLCRELKDRFDWLPDEESMPDEH